MRFTVPKPSLLVVNYPANPTAEPSISPSTSGSSPSPRSINSGCISDLAYSEIYFDGNPTPSILQVPGAKDVAIEFTSLQQDLFHGRLAHRLCGRQQAADRGADRVKSYLDYGAFTPIQAAARRRSTARRIIVENRQLYKDRRDVLVEGLAAPAGHCRRRTPRCSPGRRCRRRSQPRQPGILQASADRGRRRRRRPASAMAKTAKAMCASPWSKTSSACARRAQHQAIHGEECGGVAPRHCPTRPRPLGFQDNNLAARGGQRDALYRRHRCRPHVHGLRRL